MFRTALISSVYVIRNLLVRWNWASYQLWNIGFPFLDLRLTIHLYNMYIHWDWLQLTKKFTLINQHLVAGHCSTEYSSWQSVYPTSLKHSGKFTLIYVFSTQTIIVRSLFWRRNVPPCVWGPPLTAARDSRGHRPTDRLRERGAARGTLTWENWKISQGFDVSQTYLMPKIHS